MIVGVPKEIKTNENRISLIPVGVELLKRHGHTVLVESDAGIGSGFTNEDYRGAGAEILTSASTIYDKAEMIIKVKEPLPEEYALIHEGQIVFTYFHFAASEELTKAIIKSKSIAIAYETVQDAAGSLPLLVPMSEVAGRMAIQEGARCLEKLYGGKGVLLGGVPGGRTCERCNTWWWHCWYEFSKNSFWLGCARFNIRYKFGTIAVS